MEAHISQLIIYAAAATFAFIGWHARGGEVRLLSARSEESDAALLAVSAGNEQLTAEVAGLQEQVDELVAERKAGEEITGWGMH